MAFNQQLSVFGQVAPATTGTAGQVLVSAGSSASSYWAATIPVSAYSAQFNGSSNQYLSVPANAAFNFGTGNLTIECWAYFNDLSDYRTLIAFYPASGVTTGAGYWILQHIITTNKMGFYYDGGSGITGTTTLTTGTWYHVAMVRSGSTVTGYINGQPQGTATYSGTFGRSDNTVYIGTAQNISTARMNGYISNARITKGVAVYTGAFTPPTSPLGTAQAAGTNITAVTPSQVSLLTCNGSGFTDSSPNVFSLTNTSGVVTSQFAPFSSFSAIARSATQTQTVLTSGSGTYYPPSGVAWLRIRMVGGGGGGGASFAAGSGTQTSSGTNTIFGDAQAYGGSGGWNSYFAAGGAGGSGTIGSFSGTVITGARGSAVGVASVNYCGSGTGGSTPFGGAGAGSMNGAGFAASTNSGSGGGGGGGNASASTTAGTGGGAGGYVEAYISSPAASYAYTVGAGGGGGAAGVFAGGGGGSGIIIVEENYPVNSSLNIATASIIGFSDSTSFGTAQSLGTRNKFINGDMRINQRNTAVSTDAAYSVDRWRLIKSNDATESVAQSTDAPTGFTHSLRNTVTTADTSIGAAQYSGFRQAIEGVDIIDWAFGTASAKQITLSFWVKSTVTGLYSGNITNYAETRVCPFTYTINASNTWEYKTYTFPGDTSGTWVTSTNGSMSLNLYSALGSSYYGGTAGVWGAPPNYGAGGASLVNALATNGNIFAITGVQLETGTVATPFERRQYQQELDLCQRYYYRHISATAYATAGAGRAYSTTNGQAVMMLPVSLRAAPGSTGYSSLAHWDGAGSGNINSLSPASEYTSDFRTFTINIGMTYVNGQSVILNAKNTIGAWIEWSADI